MLQGSSHSAHRQCSCSVALIIIGEMAHCNCVAMLSCLFANNCFLLIGEFLACFSILFESSVLAQVVVSPPPACWDGVRGQAKAVSSMAGEGRYLDMKDPEGMGGLLDKFSDNTPEYLFTREIINQELKLEYVQ